MAAGTILFDAIRNILTTKSMDVFYDHTDNEEKWKTFSKFMVMKYMTMSPNPVVRDIVLDNIIQLDRMPPKQLYLWLLKTIPRQHNGYIRYIK